MLKLNYTESGLYLERIAAPLEMLVAQRVMLALRSGRTLHVEPGKASFLIAANTPGIQQLEAALRLEQNFSTTLSPVDSDFVEVSVQGSWLAESAYAEEGTFVTALSDRTEFFVYKLWQLTQEKVSFVA